MNRNAPKRDLQERIVMQWIASSIAYTICKTEQERNDALRDKVWDEHASGLDGDPEEPTEGEDE